MAHAPAPAPGNHYITTHSPTGSSIFLSISVPASKPILSSPSLFTDLHVAPTVPVSLNLPSVTSDLEVTGSFLSTNQHASTLSDNGVVFRIVSMPPGAETPMHRTPSLDYAVLIEGSVELVLEGNGAGKEEKRVLKPGDTVVQRGTMHAWRNVGQVWASMVFVMMPAILDEVDHRAELGGAE